LQPASIRTAQRTRISATYLAVERKPITAYDDNPVFDERSAAILVGVSAELLKKWRQRNQGPDYNQYGLGGTVPSLIRYALSLGFALRISISVNFISPPKRPAGNVPPLGLKIPPNLPAAKQGFHRTRLEGEGVENVYFQLFEGIYGSLRDGDRTYKTVCWRREGDSELLAINHSKNDDFSFVLWLCYGFPGESPWQTPKLCS
jgi:hypothetical protein